MHNIHFINQRVIYFHNNKFVFALAEHRLYKLQHNNHLNFSLFLGQPCSGPSQGPLQQPDNQLTTQARK